MNRCAYHEETQPRQAMAENSKQLLCLIVQPADELFLGRVERVSKAFDSVDDVNVEQEDHAMMSLELKIGGSCRAAEPPYLGTPSWLSRWQSPWFVQLSMSSCDDTAMYPSMPVALAPDSLRTEALRRGITTIHLDVSMTL